MTARVVNVTSGEPYDVYIGRAMPRRRLRGSKWANPYKIGPDCPRERAIELYRLYLHDSPELLAALPELRGKRLGCWCAPEPCHGDVLVELANGAPDRSHRSHRVLVCGSRTWTDAATIARVLGELPEGTVIIHGAARGADYLAGIEAEGYGFKLEEYPADWRLGRRAGPLRNQRMLDEGRPDRVIAFRMPGPSRGTDDMVRRARAAGIPVEVILEG